MTIRCCWLNSLSFGTSINHVVLVQGEGGGSKIAYCMAFFKWLAYIKYEGFLQELEMAFVFAVKISIYIVCFEEFCFFISKH